MEIEEIRTRFGPRALPLIGTIVAAAGAVLLVAGIAIAIALSEPVAMIAAFLGLVDLAIGLALRSGRWSGHRPPRDAVAASRADPSYNPYARED